MTAVRPQISEREIKHLFSAPHVAVQLLGACQAAVFSPPSLQKIVLQDSALCASVLNAAIISCPEQIRPSAPLSSALAGLGLPVIKSLALQSAKRLVKSNFTAGQVQFMRELWFYSQVGGAAARTLAAAISYPDPEEAQLTGLLLNIGMITLFSQDPEGYLNNIGGSLSSAELRDREQSAFQADHLQVADLLISAWLRESFMADAVSFLHFDVSRCQEASPLVRIARLSQEVCRSPFALSNEIRSAAALLFNFTPSETEDFFALTEKSYRNLSPFNGDQDGCLEEMGRVQKRLTSMAFSIAEQEGICRQLADAVGIEGFVGTARHLYLQNSAAQEAVVFMYDHQSSRLTGLPAVGQPRRIAELTTSLNSVNLFASALQSSKVRHSFDRENALLNSFDQQLLRLCKGRGIVCLPLRAEGQLFGGIALGVEDDAGVESLTTPQIQLLTDSVARGLGALAGMQGGGFEEKAGRDDLALIPKLIHEVSNPLTIINNYMSAVGTLLAGTEHEEILPAIEDEVRRIGDILKYYSEQNELTPLTETPVDLNALISSVVESLKATSFQANQIEVLIDVDPGLSPVKSKPVLIRQILVNLLKNAAEAQGEGGRISVRTRGYLRSDGRHFVDITVQDAGPGIAPQIQERLFLPVTSTKGGGHAGLGLNIVKGMADDLGATISCYSSPLSGTTFTLVLPRMKE